MSRTVVVLFTGLSLVLAGCGDDGPSIENPPANHAPVAAGTASAAEVKVGDVVTIDGSQSSDIDHDALTFTWKIATKPDGSKATLAAPSNAKTSFTADVAGKYVLTLSVSDGKGKTADASVSVTATARAENGKPTAKATTSSADVAVATAITLDGSTSSDPDGDAITFAWSVTSAPATSTAKLSSGTSAKPTFTPDIVGAYEISLVVTDAKGLASDAFKIALKAHAAHENGAPTAVAEADATVVVGHVVTLKGTNSTDPENDKLTYAWSLTKTPAGSTAALTGAAATAVTTTFTADKAGEYVAQLIVTDEHGAKSAPKSVSVTASVANNAPTAVATPSRSELPLGNAVTLDGSHSTDPEGDALTYAWTIKSQPAGGSATIPAADAVKASFDFKPALKGSYVFELVVTDAHGAKSAAATATFEAKDRENSAPTAHITLPTEAEIGTSVTLDGSSTSDIDGDTFTLAWTLVSTPNGSAATISDATSLKPTIKPDLVGSYVVSLVATDSKGKASTVERASFLAVVVDAAPTAVATASTLEVETGAVVTLDGSASHDDENQPLTYAWTLVSKPDQSAVALSNATTPKPTFTADKAGTYVFALVVNDGHKSSAEARVTVTATALNVAPTAVATASATQIRVGGEILLNGDASSDPEHANLTYAWAVRAAPVGSTAALASATSANTSFKADVKGFYKFELVVNDGAKASAPATVTVEVKDVDATPSAKATISANAVELGQAVVLDGGTSSDPENEPLTYTWAVQSAPAGSTAALASTATSRTAFTADKLGQYVFTLIVSDTAGNVSEASRVTLTVAADNAEPTARATVASAQVEIGRVVTLDGSASRDPENAPITYAWRVRSAPLGSTATLSNVAAAKPTFSPDKIGVYVFELKVSDGVKQSAPAIVTITATQANLPPVVTIAASANQVNVGGVVTFDSTGSFDPENGILVRQWTVVSKPLGSNALFSAAERGSAKASLTLDKVGFYVIEMSATDGTSTTRSTRLTVSAVVANAAPTASAQVVTTPIAAGAVVTLDGSASHDPENTALTFAWRVVSVPTGSAAALSDATAAKPTFTADKAGDYVFELVVKDAAGLPSQAVTITATATP